MSLKLFFELPTYSGLTVVQKYVDHEKFIHDDVCNQVIYTVIMRT